MNRRTHGLPALLLLVGACSLINAPEALKPTDEGGGGSQAEAGSKNGGSANNAGSVNQAGGTNGEAGALPGAGGCGVDCGEGGAPPLGRACDVSSKDCGSTAPICDPAAGECRACANDAECSKDLGKAFCIASGPSAGRCAECKTNATCVGKTPICGNTGVCRACSTNDECDSGVCDPIGSCGVTSGAVYALAQTGSFAANCGTIDLPCLHLADATSKLSLARHNLVLLKTAGKINDGGASFPAVKDIRVIGNGVVVAPFDGISAFKVPAGASVSFENVVIQGVKADQAAGILCTGGGIAVVNSTLQDNNVGVAATDCDVTVVQSLIKHNAAPYNNGDAAIQATCTTAHCAKTVALLRNKFVDNGKAIYLDQQASANIENNLFLRNGADGYTRVIELRADQTHLAYNTLVENFNSCTYVGIVACIGGCTNVGNISFNNFPAETTKCYDQVWYQGTMSHSLTEVAYPGSTNKAGDPMFVDAANGDFTLSAGSPALDKGDPKDFPNVDLNGNKRPVGAAPDMGAFEKQ